MVLGFCQRTGSDTFPNNFRHDQYTYIPPPWCRRFSDLWFRRFLFVRPLSSPTRSYWIYSWFVLLEHHLALIISTQSFVKLHQTSYNGVQIIRQHNTLYIWVIFVWRNTDMTHIYASYVCLTMIRKYLYHLSNISCWRIYVWCIVWREKEEILLSPMTKAPSPTEKSKKQRENKKRHQNVDCGPT